jgi:AraC-like DNA-binding protein
MLAGLIFVTSRPGPEMPDSSIVAISEKSLTSQLQFGSLTFSVEFPLARDSSLAYHAEFRRLPGAIVCLGAGFPGHDRTMDAALSSSSDDVVFAAILKGRARASQHGREEIIEQDHAILMTTGDVGRHISSHDTQHLIVQVERAALSIKAPNLDTLLMRALRLDERALRLLTTHCQEAIDLDESAPANLQHHIVADLCSLIALLMLGRENSSNTSRPSSTGTLRLHAIKAAIEAQLGNHSLSAETLAASQKISPDYVRKLFRDNGLSLSEYLLERRLAFAHALLLDPLRADERIGKIADEAGFSDLSYFNRTFRRRYATSPSDLRRARGSRS